VSDVTIYTKQRCVHCFRAKRRLRRRGATIREVPAGRDVEAMRAELARRFGVSTFPQIVIGERHIGGAAELVKLDKAGDLQRLLAA
jgi:glutaredoxin